MAIAELPETEIVGYVSVTAAVRDQATHAAPTSRYPTWQFVATHVPAAAPHVHSLAPEQVRHAFPQTFAPCASQKMPHAGTVASQPPQVAWPPDVGSGHGVQRVPQVATAKDETQAPPQTCWSVGQRQT
jgi:hypothetical protein